MDLETYDPKNPYFKHDIDKICAVCTKKLEKGSSHLLEAEILPQDSTKAYEVLANISNFKIYDDGPRFLCSNCYINTTSAYKFQKMCNRSQVFLDNFIRHQELLLAENIKANEDVAMEEIKIKVTETDACVEINKSRMKTNTKKVQCKVCNKMLRADNLSVHMRIHTGEKPYKCKYCNAAFSQWATLKYHIESHENKRQFVCGFCGLRFNNASRLMVHERYHSDKRPYQCKDCNLAFVTKDGLKRHIVVHTKEKPYTCEYCAKSYNRRSTLRVHLKIHTGERPHVCHLCGKGFIQRQSLKSHLQSHTGKNLARAAGNTENVPVDVDSGDDCEEFVVEMPGEEEEIFSERYVMDN